MIAHSTGYSTELEGFLCVDGRRLPLHELGPDFCVVRSAIAAPPSPAEILLSIDGQESRFAVMLPEGIAPSQTRVTYQKVDTN
jgi:hypothetical protein